MVKIHTCDVPEDELKHLKDRNKPNVANHYSTAVCPECGAEYEKYHALQTTCKKCKPRVRGFLLPTYIWEMLPEDDRAQFVKDAIVEKYTKDNT